MFAQIKFLILYAAVVINLTFGILYWLNPNQKTWWNNQKHYNDSKPAIASVWSFEPSNLNLDNIGYYRADKHRTGYFNSSIHPSKLKVSQISAEQINIGIHSASKASVAVNKDYIVTASDFGLLSVYRNTKDHPTQPIWSFMGYNSTLGIHSTPLLVGDTVIWGDYAGILHSYNLTQKQFNWITDLGDTVGATPNIDSKGHIYISIETLSLDGYIVKVDSKTGATIWTSKYLGEQGHSSATLNEDETLLIVGDNKGHLTAIKTDTGEFYWRILANGPIKSTAALHKNIAVVSSWDSYLYAVDIKTGTIIWKRDLKTPYIQSSPAISLHDNTLVALSAGHICKYNLFNGERLQCAKVKFARSTIKSSPIITHNPKTKQSIIWTSCGLKDLCAIDYSSMTIVQKWDTLSASTGEPTLFDDEIFLAGEFLGGLLKLKPSSISPDN